MTVKPVNPVVEQEARLPVVSHRQAEPDITKVFWFPDDQEVRLLELTEQVPIALDGEVHPFYFRPSPKDDLPLASAIAMIRAEVFGKLKLPGEWGSWSDAVEL